ncbi:hypothetical protein [Falsiroseomonas sp. HW251]|uniref:hypothetical protein n=1 Tax=Falsiroseomonas sp. HW251 TaxID=3390998 RepID=UPI003D319A5A
MDLTQPSARHAEAVLAAIETLGGTVAVARALVESGRMIELAGLERDCAMLCAAMMALDPPEAKRLRPALEELLFQVNRLASQLDPA